VPKTICGQRDAVKPKDRNSGSTDVRGPHNRGLLESNVIARIFWSTRIQDQRLFHMPVSSSSVAARLIAQGEKVLLAARIAALTNEIEIRPSIGQPIITWVEHGLALCLLRAGLWAIVLDVSGRDVRDIGLAVTTLIVLRCLQRLFDICMPVNGFVEFECP
jgi:hypothetical protein